jgi:hypothetical protein
MWTSTHLRLAAAALAGASLVAAQEQPLKNAQFNINFPVDSPVTLLSLSLGDSHTSMRGAALMIDLHTTLMLRNNRPNRIHGVTLRVVAQEVALGGRGSVSIPNLNIGPGESFPVPIDMQLMRPSQVEGGALVDVNLDGVIFQDLSFWGPDRLNSRRTMTGWEMEARRDRDHYRRVLAQGGPKALQQAILESMAHRPQLDVRVMRGPAVTSAALSSETPESFACLEFPDSPIKAIGGWARVAGNEASAPHIQVLNRSEKPVKYVELAWLVRDEGGQKYLAVSLPTAEPGIHLAAGKTAEVEQDTVLRFMRDGRPVNVQAATGFVRRVQFADGQLWVPTREDLERYQLEKTLPPSIAEQSLAAVYLKKGIQGLIEDLKKY